MIILHAGLIALRIGGYWRGVLIQGASGAGKSDLALRALDDGFRLVADDRTVVWASGGALFGRAPEVLAGLIEARGQGLVSEAPLALAEILLVAALAKPDAIERMPEPDTVSIVGVTVARLSIDAQAPSAPARLRRAMEHLGAARQQAYQACPLGGGAPRRDRG
ncbi:MAG TPA: HPr kinase/phosphorylase [Caulobacteraceae bacterium]|nr:HPr kinase/phosphorylase [Caulobacteraceae bacterium]